MNNLIENALRVRPWAEFTSKYDNPCLAVALWPCEKHSDGILSCITVVFFKVGFSFGVNWKPAKVREY